MPPWFGHSGDMGDVICLPTNLPPAMPSAQRVVAFSISTISRVRLGME
jgi:hypothetical protein